MTAPTYKDLSVLLARPQAVKRLFWARTSVTENCWVWTGARSSLGYGRLTIWHPVMKKSVNVAAHRLSLAIHGKPLPAGMDIDHHCNNPACVRPDHLRPISHRQNLRKKTGADIADPNLRSAYFNGKVCKRGHDLTATGRWNASSQQYQCRACDRERMKRSRTMKRTAAPIRQHKDTLA